MAEGIVPPLRGSLFLLPSPGLTAWATLCRPIRGYTIAQSEITQSQFLIRVHPRLKLLYTKTCFQYSLRFRVVVTCAAISFLRRSSAIAFAACSESNSP